MMRIPAAAIPLVLAALPAPGQPGPPADRPGIRREAVSEEQWARIDAAVQRALLYIGDSQDRDGAFAGPASGQPAITCLGVLAMLGKGGSPGEGPFGDAIARGIRYTLSCRKPDGLITLLSPGEMYAHNPAHTAIYNHAIAGLLLSEAYGTFGEQENLPIREALESAIAFTLNRQKDPKPYRTDEGGWRYIRDWEGSSSDLSVTSWQLMFLRSARNAGFDIPAEPIDAALAYVRRCYSPKDQAFWYGLIDPNRYPTRAMAAAGILSLSLGGLHHTLEAQQAGDWLLRHPFDPYLGTAGLHNDSRYFYGLFYASQAMYQLGGHRWERFYPGMASVLLAHQSADGSWDPEPGEDFHYGRAYTTALASLALGVPDQLLPVFQR